jgi:hypothetical protein
MDIQFKQTLKVFSILFGVLVFGVLLGVTLVRIGYIPTGDLPASGLASASQTVKQNEIAVTLTIDYGNGDTQMFSEQPLQNGQSVLDLFEQSKVVLEKRYFPGVGAFIEAINGVHNSNTYYWQYWVNGKYATVAAELYKLQNGDKVLWKRTNELPK